MSKTGSGSIFAVVVMFLFWGFGNRDQQEISLAEFEPDGYQYVDATRCANCHSDGGDILRRAVGVDASSGHPVLDERGWLSSVHARSQSHENRVTTACAWCHAPTTPGATRDSLAAESIEPGTWQGVSCGACHPVGLADSLEESLVTNLRPGSDRADPTSYTFRDRSDPMELNALCQYCHHEFHGFLVESKTAMSDSGKMRCIDCHMAGYATAESGLVERFHNMKVEANLPLSCSGSFGTDVGCHTNGTADRLRAAIPMIKGGRQEW